MACKLHFLALSKDDTNRKKSAGAEVKSTTSSVLWLNGILIILVNEPNNIHLFAVDIVKKFDTKNPPCGCLIAHKLL